MIPKPTLDQNIKRFWSHVNKCSGMFAIVNGKKSECWLWTAGCDEAGYGRLTLDGKVIFAHQASFMFSRKLKVRPKDLTCHHCDNPPCVRPSHLFKGTPLSNMVDMIKKGRDKKAKGEKSGKAKLSEKQVIEILKLYASGKAKISVLAKAYHVGYNNVHDIVSRKTWKHLKGAIL